MYVLSYSVYMHNGIMCMFCVHEVEGAKLDGLVGFRLR